jgi:hypothetical protein
MDSEALAGLAARLSPWHHCWAEVWDYSASHGVLRIKLAKRAAEPCAILMLRGCTELAFSSSWDRFAATFQALPDNAILVQDATHLRVKCMAAIVSDTLESYSEIPHMSDDGQRWSGAGV